MKDKTKYVKHDSFIDLSINIKQNEKLFFNNLKEICYDKNNLIDLNDYQIDIFKRARKDLFELIEPSKDTFAIKENVIKEINTLENKDIPKYLFHRYRYEIFPKTKELDDYPPYIQIEPSSVCNYRCVFCYQTDLNFTKKSNGFMGKMSLEMFKGIVDQVQGNVEFISLASRGEPLLCPKIDEMLEYTVGKFLNLKINTNASLLSEKNSHVLLSSGIKTIVFSADAADEKLYSKYRVNGNLNKVLRNIEKFREIKEKHYSKKKIITRVSGVKVSEDQKMEDMEGLWGGLVDQVAFVDYIPWENVYDSPVSNINEPCSDLWRRMFIWFDGKINPCDVDYRSELSTGNFKNENINNLWNSINYNSLRENHLNKKRQTKGPCNKCVVV